MTSPLLAPPLTVPAAGLALCTCHSPSEARLTATALPSRRISDVLHRLSIKAAEPLRGTTALRLLSAKAVA
eukprot:2245524-Pleurochrysis_carterae.AAC.1